MMVMEARKVAHGRNLGYQGEQCKWSRAGVAGVTQREMDGSINMAYMFICVCISKEAVSA